MVSCVGKTARGAVASGLALLVLVACSQADSSIPASTPTATPQPTPEPSITASQEARVLTFDIAPMGTETEARGTVVVDIAGGGYTMTITVENLVPNGQYPINTHSGACPNPEIDPATAVWIVQQTPADEAGTLTYEKTFDIPWDVPEAGRTLTIHGRVPNESGTHIACADLTE
jgi:hypothetical protein